jgi:AraC-like DNA-binding protein
VVTHYCISIFTHSHGTNTRSIFDAEFSIGLIPLTFGPFLYLYAKYLIKPVKKFSPNELLHFAPFLILVSIYFVVFKDRFSIQAFAMSISISTFFLITSLIYTGLVFMLLRRFRNTIRPNMFSYDTTSNRLFWLNYLSIIYAVTYLIYFVTKFYSAFAETDSRGLEIIPSVGFDDLTYSVSYFSIKQPNLFKNETPFDEDKDSYRKAISDKLVTLETLSKPTPTISKEVNQPKEEIPADKLAQLEKLSKYMQEAKPYLNPELTLQDLSSKLNLPKHQITQLLNNYLNKNFFEYINEFRIEETKKRMLDSNYEHLTLVAIAYECGFNSKSTFNTIF